jgi:hypothetical protein
MQRLIAGLTCSLPVSLLLLSWGHQTLSCTKRIIMKVSDISQYEKPVLVNAVKLSQRKQLLTDKGGWKEWLQVSLETLRLQKDFLSIFYTAMCTTVSRFVVL